MFDLVHSLLKQFVVEGLRVKRTGNWCDSWYMVLLTWTRPLTQIGDLKQKVTQDSRAKNWYQEGSGMMERETLGCVFRKTLKDQVSSTSSNVRSPLLYRGLEITTYFRIISLKYNYIFRIKRKRIYWIKSFYYYWYFILH